jgi:formylglycine-generating enzyme required for sulfatase activity
MTTSNSGDKDDQKQWEAVLSGERLPAEHSDSEQEADALRQVLIWRNAKQVKTQHTPDDAAAFYQHLHDIQKARKRAAFLRWLKIGSAAVLLSLIGAGVWYYLDQKNTDTTTFIDPSTQQNNPSADQQVPNKTLPLIPELVAVPAGNFAMGCTAGWDDTAGGCRSNEYPSHSVDIKAFRMGRYEVTIGQFKHFVNETNYQTVAEQNNQGCSMIDPESPNRWIIKPLANWRKPGYTQTDSHPVVCLSWQDTQQYLTWLNSKTGNQYRLPTESEWEYSARAGRVTAFYWGDKGDRRYANYRGVAENDTWQNSAPVGRHINNNFGLHDMSGNAWEWTASCWRENYQTPELSSEKCDGVRRARRGGGWDNSAPSIRSAYRSSGSEVERSNLYGFRVAHDF